MEADTHTLSAARLLSALKARQLSAPDVTGAFIERIERLDQASELNAVAALCPDARARAEALARDPDAARLPLYGLPILVKDNIDVEGMPTTAGSLALAGNTARRDARVVANLRKNGAIILGKTNMTEFANYVTKGMPGGYSARGGQVKSAYGRALEASGSSTGSAVAVSAGFCAAAVGTDTSFSIVACAINHGVVGVKPAVGSLSADGIVPIARTLDSAGPLARTLEDALIVYSGMHDAPLPPVKPKPERALRLAINIAGRSDVGDKQWEAYDAMLDGLRRAGASVSEISQPPTPLLSVIMRCEFRRDLEAYLACSDAPVKTLADIVSLYEAEPERAMVYGITHLREALASSADDPAYQDALCERSAMRARLLDELSPFDACLMTGPTNVMHFAGLPSLSLPMCMGSNGAPRGAILYGKDEQTLLSAALTIERYGEGVTPPKL